MKRVLITGANSYVGTNVEKWLMKEPDNFYVETLDMRDPNWKNFDFSKFDVVFHVAGIAHVKETKKNRDLYYKINRDLAIDTAIKAKESGVKQFIFMSSMSIYGDRICHITKDTKPNPISFYGDSKYQAENIINKMNEENFHICILRPPMVYGLNSIGNYRKLSKLVKYLRFFPTYKNKRSMIYIGNLSSFIQVVIEKSLHGIFYPQNTEYVCTSNMVNKILNCSSLNYMRISFLNPIISMTKFGLIKKIFGDLYYDLSISNHELGYVKFSFDQSIELTERNVNS